MTGYTSPVKLAIKHPKARDLTWFERWLLMRVASIVNEEHGYEYWEDRELLSQWTDTAPTNVSRGMRKLVAEGWLEVISDGQGRGHRKVYRWCFWPSTEGDQSDHHSGKVINPITLGDQADHRNGTPTSLKEKKVEEPPNPPEGGRYAELRVAVVDTWMLTRRKAAGNHVRDFARWLEEEGYSVEQVASFPRLCEKAGFTMPGLGNQNLRRLFVQHVGEPKAPTLSGVNGRVVINARGETEEEMLARLDREEAELEARMKESTT